MSSSSSEPGLSVVIGSTGPLSALEGCLAALAPQRDGTEVLVCCNHDYPSALRERFAWARVIECRGAFVPALWTLGIDDSRGAIVALTIAVMRPQDGWVQAVHRAHAEADVVAGAIEPDSDLSIADWAEYLCRYVPDMLPFVRRESLDLPGDNASYNRALLQGVRDLYRDGFWEPVVHRRLAAEGVRLIQTPDIVVRQGPSGGTRAFVRQRLHHGRAHGGQRGARFGTLRNLAGVAGSPLVPVLLTLRVLQAVFAKGRHRARAVLALPHIMLFNVAWALGEARGHLDALRAR